MPALSASKVPIGAYLTPPTIARELGVKVDKILTWIRSGKLVAVNLGNGPIRPRFRVKREDLERFLDSRRVQPPPKRGRRPRAPESNYRKVFEE